MCLRPWSAVICHVESHVYADEAGAVEHAAHGAKLLPVDGADCKLTTEAIARCCDRAMQFGDYGGVPVAVSVTQVNEAGLLSV